MSHSLDYALKGRLGASLVLLLSLFAASCSATTSVSSPDPTPVAAALGQPEEVDPPEAEPEQAELEDELLETVARPERVAFGSTTWLRKSEPGWEGDAVPVVWNVQVGPLGSLGDDWPDVVAFEVAYGIADTPWERANNGLVFDVVAGTTGETVRARSSDCPEPFEGRAPGNLLTGGTLEALLCLRLDAADLASPDTSVVVTLSDDEVVFGIGGSPSEPWPVMASSPGSDDGFAFGEPTVVEANSGSLWSLQVDEPRTTADHELGVLFVDPERSGATFVEFNITATLVRHPEGMAPVGSWDFGIAGWATGRQYPASELGGCQTWDGALRSPEDIVAVGDTITGTLCTVAVDSDIAHANLQLALVRFEAITNSFGQEPVVFRRSGTPGVTIDEIDASD